MDARRRLSQKLHELPLPIAQLVRRALNAKSGLERHHNAFYLAEASLKLAATVRIGVWLEHCLEPGGRVEQTLESLVMPSLGHWVGYLRTLDAALAERPDAGLLPLSDLAGQLSQPRDLPAAVAFAELASAAEVAPSDAARRIKKGGTQAFFDTLVAYRNAVLGHGAQRATSFYDELGSALLEAYTELLETDLLLGGRQLMQATPGETAIGWRLLTGLSGLPALADDLPPLPPNARPVPGHVYIAGAGELVSLHPLAVFHEDALEREVVGLLNKTVRRTKRTGEAEVEEVRRADYLDYASGEIIDGVDARGALTELLSRLRARAVTDDEVAAVEDASRVGDEEDVADVVSGGAAIGDFEILDELGRGGMGIVYRARQRTLGRIVALKVLPPSLAANPTAVKRFQQEIRALARSDHPNVVRILSSGVANDRHFFAMEFVDGADLASVTEVLEPMRSQGGLTDRSLADAASTSRAGDGRAPLTKSRTQASVSGVRSGSGPRYHRRLAELFADVARGLHHLHEVGIIHRDVKPQNLVLSADGTRLVLMDLGLALVSDRSEALTKTAAGVLGTLRYAPPEQLGPDRAGVDARADVYGLGATLYQMVTGRPPHDAETEGALVRQILDSDAPAPRRIDPLVPRDLDAILRVCLDRDRKRRYPTALALALDLERFAAGEPVRARPGGIGRAVARFLFDRPAAVALTVLLMGLGGLAVGGLGVGAVYWWAGLPTYVYAHDLDWVYGVPTALVELDDFQQRHRFRVQRITIDDNKVTRVDWIDSHGNLVDHEDGASWLYSYRDNGALTRVDVLDRFGNLQLYNEYSPDLQLQTRKSPQGLSLPEEGTMVSVFSLEYGAGGHVVRQTHRDANNQYVLDAQGIGSYVVARTPRGQLESIRYLDADRRPTPRRDGVFELRHTYDERGFRVESSTWDADGALFEVGGVAVNRNTYDDYGNMTGWQRLDANGELVRDKTDVARTEWAFDDRGDLVGEWVFGPDGTPTIARESRVHHEAYAYDRRGNRTHTAYFGPTGEKTWHAQGYHAIDSEYDGDHNETRRRYTDPDGDPATVVKETYSEIRWEYDERGNIVEARYYGPDGNPVITSDGTAGWRTRYNKFDQDERTEWLDIAGNIAAGESQVAIRTYVYETGRVAELHYFDADERPVMSNDGYAGVAYEYDALGNIEKLTYLGTDGAPKAVAAGYAVWVQKRDERGNVVEERNLGPDGAPVLDSDCGCAGWNATYDERGNRLTKEMLGLDLQPAPDSDGIWGLRSEFNALSQETRRTLLGPDGEPLVVPDGHAGWTRTYDDRGNTARQMWLGADGEPLMQPEGYAGTAYGWDARGRLVDKVYLDASGAPSEGDRGFARVLFRYPYVQDPDTYYALRLDMRDHPVQLEQAGWVPIPDGKVNFAQELEPGMRVMTRVTSVKPGSPLGIEVGDLLFHIECVADGDGCSGGTDMDRPTVESPTAPLRVHLLRGPDLERITVDALRTDVERLEADWSLAHPVVPGDPDAWARRYWLGDAP
ncbi:MAG: protein kinase [Myxococcota bacterium]